MGNAVYRGTGVSMGWWVSRRSYYREFRGRTRSSNGRDKVQLGGKRVGKWDKRGWLHVNRLVVSTLAWPCPAPGHYSLSCLLIKLCSWLFSWVRGSLFCVSLRRAPQVTETVSGVLASWDTRLQACCVWVCTSVCPAMCICVYLYSVHVCLFRNTHSGRTWGYEAAEVSPLLGYCICRLLIDLSSADEQLQVWDTQYVTEDLAQGHCRIPVGLQFANRRLFLSTSYVFRVYRSLCSHSLPFSGKILQEQNLRASSRQ